MTVCYGIKCISSKSSEPISTAGRGGWTLGSRGLETWCKTFVFPFYDINEVHQELHKWGLSSIYSYVVEEIPLILLPSLLDNTTAYKSIYTFDANSYYNPVKKIKQDTIREIQEQEDKRVFDTINSSISNNTSTPTKSGALSDDDLKKALQQLVKYAADLETKQNISFDGYTKSFNPVGYFYKNDADGYGWDEDEYSLGGEF